MGIMRLRQNMCLFPVALRAYCQGYVDCIQLLAGLGILKQSPDIEKIINGMK
jgi:hypothetical protein